MVCMFDYKIELENRRKVIWQFYSFNKTAEGNFHCTSYVSDSLKDTEMYEIQVFALKDQGSILVFIYICGYVHPYIYIVLKQYNYMESARKKTVVKGFN